MNRYYININDDASRNITNERHVRMSVCFENEIDALCVEIINAHMKTVVDMNSATLLSTHQYVVEKMTDEYHLTFVRRDDSEQDDDEQEHNDMNNPVASFQII